MMLQLLNKKQFNIAISIIAISLIPLQFFTCKLPVNINVWNEAAPLATFIAKSIGVELLNDFYFNFITSSLLIYFQLFLVYNIFNKVKNIQKHSVLATWVYLWIIHFFPEMSSFSPALISATLILFIIYHFHYHIENNSSHFLFNISMIIGLAFLIWYPSILILVFMFLVLFQYNALNFKRAIIILTSFIIPLIYFFAYFIYSDKIIEILFKFSNFYISGIKFPEFSIYQVIILVIMTILMFIGSFQALSFLSQTAKTSRLFMNSLFTFVVISILGAFLSPNNLVYSCISICFPMSLFLVYYINIFKRPLFAELAHLGLILLILINFAFSF